MKKTLYFFVVIVIAFMASVNVSAQNELGLNDFRYKAALLEAKHYSDHYVYSVGDDPTEYSCCIMPKHGAFIGLQAGVQSFDGHVVPNLGAIIGYEGKHLGVEYEGTFAKGDYTKEADRDNSYAEFDSKLTAKFKVLDNKSHSWQVWAGVYGSYKLNFDYHKNESTNTTIKETEDEIITTTDKTSSDYEFKGSTMGYGGQIEVIHRPFMSRFSVRLKVSVGAQQRYYTDGSDFKPEVRASIGVAYNLFGATWDKSFLAKTGLSKKRVKQLYKTRAKQLNKARAQQVIKNY